MRELDTVELTEEVDGRYVAGGSGLRRGDVWPAGTVGAIVSICPTSAQVERPESGTGSLLDDLLWVPFESLRVVAPFQEGERNEVEAEDLRQAFNSFWFALDDALVPRQRIKTTVNAPDAEPVGDRWELAAVPPKSLDVLSFEHAEDMTGYGFFEVWRSLQRQARLAGRALAEKLRRINDQHPGLEFQLNLGGPHHAFWIEQEDGLKATVYFQIWDVTLWSRSVRPPFRAPAADYTTPTGLLYG